jgi:hypothetical protein
MTVISARTAEQKSRPSQLDGQCPAAEKRAQGQWPTGLETGAVVQQYELEYLEPREIYLEKVHIRDRIVMLHSDWVT